MEIVRTVDLGLFIRGEPAFSQVTSDVIGGICGLVSLAALGFHLLFEDTASLTGRQWIAVGLLGLGPVGAAFFAWDHATKHGRLSLLGALSYLAPLISTLLLAVSGFAPASWPLLGAALLIVVGASLAASRI